jgi:hypothetical protein
MTKHPGEEQVSDEDGFDEDGFIEAFRRGLEAAAKKYREERREVDIIPYDMQQKPMRP